MDIGLLLKEQDNPRPKAGESRGQFVSEERDRESPGSLAGPKSRKAPPAGLRRPRGNGDLVLSGGSPALWRRSESGRSDFGRLEEVEADVSTRDGLLDASAGEAPTRIRPRQLSGPEACKVGPSERATLQVDTEGTVFAGIVAAVPFVDPSLDIEVASIIAAYNNGRQG